MGGRFNVTPAGGVYPLDGMRGAGMRTDDAVNMANTATAGA